MTSGTSKLQPRYREAYPRLDAIEAVKAFPHRPVCVFRDQEERLLGLAILIRVDERFVVFEARVAVGGIVFKDQQLLLKIEHAPTAMNPFRHFFICPKCARRKVKIVFAGEWACAECLGLRYRRQLVDKAIVRREKWRQLREQLRRGRPHGMHQRTYAKLKAELHSLERGLELRQLFASERHQRLVTATWQTPEESTEILLNYGIAFKDGTWIVDPPGYW